MLTFPYQDEEFNFDGEEPEEELDDLDEDEDDGA